MKTSELFLAVFLTGGALLAAGQTAAGRPAASPDNDRGSSAYGNNTYGSGAHRQAPASMNSNATVNPSVQGQAKGNNPNHIGSPNASHTSTPKTESAAANNSTTNPSTTDAGNGNSAGRGPSGADGSNTRPPQMSIAAPVLQDGSQRLLAELQQPTGSSAQSNPGGNSAGQQSSSASSIGSTGTPQPPSPDTGGNAALQSRIDDALRNEPTLGASHVTSTVSDTGIELSGTVGSTKDKQTAERIASSFNGNRKLTDNIAVTGAGHSDLAPNHPAMNNGGVGNAPNPAMNNPQKQK